MRKEQLALFFVLFSAAIPVFSQNGDVTEETKDNIFSNPDQEASFPGGQPAFDEFVASNLDSNVAQFLHANAGNYRVALRFVVLKNGDVSDIRAETNLGNGLEAEAIRLIKRSSNWLPAVQHGTIVNSYFVQQVNFSVAQPVAVKVTDVRRTIGPTGEVEADFPGGQKLFKQFLERNLNPDLPGLSTLKDGMYTVIIKFVVLRDGSLSAIEAETNLGHGMEDEAIRVLQLSPKWFPALKDGTLVNAYRVQPISFLVSHEQPAWNNVMIQRNYLIPIIIF